jgi:hypothetical protein
VVLRYCFGKEDWDSTAWGFDEFDMLFKNIVAIDKRKCIFVVCFGTTDILYHFNTAAKVIFY